MMRAFVITALFAACGCGDKAATKRADFAADVAIQLNKERDEVQAVGARLMIYGSFCEQAYLDALRSDGLHVQARRHGFDVVACAKAKGATEIVDKL